MLHPTYEYSISINMFRRIHSRCSTHGFRRLNRLSQGSFVHRDSFYDVWITCGATKQEKRRPCALLLCLSAAIYVFLHKFLPYFGVSPLGHICCYAQICPPPLLRGGANFCKQKCQPPREKKVFFSSTLHSWRVPFSLQNQRYHAPQGGMIRCICG